MKSNGISDSSSEFPQCLELKNILRATRHLCLNNAKHGLFLICQESLSEKAQSAVCVGGVRPPARVRLVLGLTDVRPLVLDCVTVAHSR